MYSGQIQSTGPRYCPSIEDKVVRFADREQHQIFLEPEGRNTLEYYCNGISTSLPRDVQEADHPADPRARTRRDHALRLRRRVRLRPADAAPRRRWKPRPSPASSSPARSTARPATRKPPPRAWSPGSTPRVAVTGEAAVRARPVHGLHRRPDRRPRDPRRRRALPDVHQPGRVSAAAPPRQRRPPAHRARPARSAWSTTPAGLGSKPVATQSNGLRNRLTTTRRDGVSLFQILRRHETTWADLVNLAPELAETDWPDDVVGQVVIEAKYSGYVGRQVEQIERFRRLENKPIPRDLDYGAIHQLRAEAREKFERGPPPVARPGGSDQRNQPRRPRHSACPPQATQPTTVPRSLSRARLASRSLATRSPETAPTPESLVASSSFSSRGYSAAPRVANNNRD